MYSMSRTCRVWPRVRIPTEEFSTALVHPVRPAISISRLTQIGIVRCLQKSVLNWRRPVFCELQSTWAISCSSRGKRRRVTQMASRRTWRGNSHAVWTSNVSSFPSRPLANWQTPLQKMHGISAILVLNPNARRPLHLRRLMWRSRQPISCRPALRFNRLKRWIRQVTG